MNIFVLDINPYKAASYLCDAHVVKMIVESCQLLSTTDRLHGKDDDRYKIAYQNHPCRKCLDNLYNYIWLQYHLHGLLLEYNKRYMRVHNCWNLFYKFWYGGEMSNPEILNQFTEYFAELLDFTTFPQCMPDEFRVKNSDGSTSKDIFDVLKAYRNYYKFKSKSLSRFCYKNGAKPAWLE